VIAPTGSGAEACEAATLAEALQIALGTQAARPARAAA
jgi:hypothetical protein